jgi:hypothetical protein
MMLAAVLVIVVAGFGGLAIAGLCHDRWCRTCHHRVDRHVTALNAQWAVEGRRDGRAGRRPRLANSHYMAGWQAGVDETLAGIAAARPPYDWKQETE